MWLPPGWLGTCSWEERQQLKNSRAQDKGALGVRTSESSQTSLGSPGPPQASPSPCSLFSPHGWPCCHHPQQPDQALALFQPQAFAHAVPSAWNGLPASLSDRLLLQSITVKHHFLCPALSDCPGGPVALLCGGHLCSTSVCFSLKTSLGCSHPICGAQHRTWHICGIITVIPWDGVGPRPPQPVSKSKGVQVPCIK